MRHLIVCFWLSAISFSTVTMISDKIDLIFKYRSKFCVYSDTLVSEYNAHEKQWVKIDSISTWLVDPNMCFWNDTIYTCCGSGLFGGTYNDFTANKLLGKEEDLKSAPQARTSGILLPYGHDELLFFGGEYDPPEEDDNALSSNQASKIPLNVTTIDFYSISQNTWKSLTEAKNGKIVPSKKIEFGIVIPREALFVGVKVSDLACYDYYKYVFAEHAWYKVNSYYLYQEMFVGYTFMKCHSCHFVSRKQAFVIFLLFASNTILVVNMSTNVEKHIPVEQPLYTLFQQIEKLYWDSDGDDTGKLYAFFSNQQFEPLQLPEMDQVYAFVLKNSGDLKKRMLTCKKFKNVTIEFCDN